MRTGKGLVVVFVLAMGVGAASVAGGGTGLQQVLARIPAEILRGLPPAAIEGLLSGEIPAQDFLASLGVPDPRALGAPSDLQAKQFITHWVCHNTCIVAGINDDPYNELAITGRCTGLPMTTAAGAPYGYEKLFTSADGSVITPYYYAPSGPSCTTIYNNVTRYFQTWVKSPTTRNAKVWLGASDYFKLWINGNPTPVLSRTTGGSKPWTVDEYKANVALTAGWNLIVLKHTFPQLGPANDVDPNVRYKYFSLRFCSDDAGTPFTDLVAGFDPDCDEADTAYSYTRVFVPNVAHIGGFGASQWRTDYTLANYWHMPWEYRMRYYREGNDAGTPSAEKLVQLKAFETKTWTDVIPNLFGLPDDQKGYGVVYQQDYYSLITGGYGWFQGKVYNQTANGTFGTAQPIVSCYSPGTTRVDGFFVGLRNGQYRSNFGLVPVVNKSSNVTRIRLILTAPGIPTPLVKEYTGINGYWQLNNVFKDMGVESLNTSEAILAFQFIDRPTYYYIPYVTVNDGNPGLGFTGTSDPVILLSGAIIDYPPELR